MDNKGQNSVSISNSKERNLDSFVLEKSIFSNIFGKDIKRIYIYKKAERLARAVHLVTPAFAYSPSLQKRADEIAVALVDAAVLDPHLARAALSKELLALSSLLAIARTGNLLSSMNADLIARESHILLEEIASYEEPRLSFEHIPTLAELSKATPKSEVRVQKVEVVKAPRPASAPVAAAPKGQIKDTPARGSRREAVLSILGSKGPSHIKDISMLIRDVSEKTIQRELQTLVDEGKVTKEGKRRWTKYTLAAA